MRFKLVEARRSLSRIAKVCTARCPNCKRLVAGSFTPQTGKRKPKYCANDRIRIVALYLAISEDGSRFWRAQKTSSLFRNDGGTQVTLESIRLEQTCALEDGKDKHHSTYLTFLSTLKFPKNSVDSGHERKRGRCKNCLDETVR